MSKTSPKIYVNKDVFDAYLTGIGINDAIETVFCDRIREKIAENEAFKGFTPLQMVMHDSGIKKSDKVGKIMDASTYTSGGMESNEFLFPIWLESTIREVMYAKNIISDLCDTIIPVDGNIVKSPMLNLLDENNKSAIKKVRVAELADLPTATIKMGEKAITLWKYGRALNMSYEAVRRTKIDLFSKHLDAIISDIAFQSVEAAVDVLANGDGNKNAATKIGSLATDNVITHEELTGFLIDYWYQNHYSADTITCNKTFFKQLVGMTYDPALANGASMRVKFSTPQLGDQNLKLIVADVPKIGSKDAILLSSKSMSLIRYEENGSNIQEAQSFIHNQSRMLTVSENSGYAIGTAGSNMYIENKTT